MVSSVSMVPAMYIQVAGGLNLAATKKPNVAGSVNLPTTCGMKNSAQIRRRSTIGLSRLNLSAQDMRFPRRAVYGSFQWIAPDGARAMPCPGRSAARSGALLTRDPGFWVASTGTPHLRCTATRCTACGERTWTHAHSPPDVLDAAALEPIRAQRVELVGFRPIDARHVHLHLVAHLGLQVGEVLVAHGKARQQLRVELGSLGGIDRRDLILFVGQAAPDQAPPALPLLQEVVEPADADHVALDAFHRGALRDRHLGLGDGALAFDVDRGAAEEVVDADAF